MSWCIYNFVKFPMCIYNFNVAFRISTNRVGVGVKSAIQKMNFHALNIGILHFEMIILYCRCTKKNGASTVFYRERCYGRNGKNGRAASGDGIF